MDNKINKTIITLCLVIFSFVLGNAQSLDSTKQTTDKVQTEATSINPIASTAELETNMSTVSHADISKEILDNKANSELPEGAGTKFILQVILLLIVIYFGVKFGGVALGLLGGLGISIIVFAFGDVPGNPPISVMLIISAVVTTSASLEATGALTMIVNGIEKLLKNNPKYITILAPISSFLLTAIMGTGHASYPLYPIIYDVAYKQKIRPERPMAVSAIASQMGITASPIAAAAAAIIACFATKNINIGLLDILKVTFPACLIGVLMAAFYSINRGKDLMKDPKYLARYNNLETRKEMEVEGHDVNKSTYNAKKAKTALILFLIGIISVVIIAINKDTMLPISPKTGKTINLDIMLQFVMLGVGAIIVFVTKVSPKEISNSSVFNAGMVATIMIFGIAWLSDTVIHNNEPYLLYLVEESVKAHPWTFAIAMFAVSAFLKSQAVVLTIMLPIGLAMGLPTSVIIGCIPACYAYFFFCFYPTDLAAINFDRSGTTHVGSYILNHSMMIPGLIGTTTATLVAYILANFIYTF